MSDTTNHCPIYEANAKRIEFLEAALEEAKPFFVVKKTFTPGWDVVNVTTTKRTPNLTRYLKEKPNV